ncbi:hypothetical protein BGZ93_008352 [Podila epicladia]|nr:hypothetical protein BGZ92_011514 [Podila epicladia]KAG0092388.1 hypothetical protein BGZ93_008352 [Podila epicladia]
MITTAAVYTSSPLSKKPYNASPLSKQYQLGPQPTPSVTVSPNRHSLPNANILRLNLQQQQLQQQQLQQQQPQTPPPQQRIQEKQPAKGPRLSLDTSDERLQTTTIIHHNNKQYLKLFSPGLVDSPVSFLDQKQLVEDKKLWENGPDDAFQKQLETDRREAYRGTKKKERLGED